MVLSVSFHFFKWLPAGIGPGTDCPFYEWNQAMQTFGRRNFKAATANKPDV